MHKVGIAFSTKDRVELSKRTILPLLGQPFDLHWSDGSATREGVEYAESFEGEIGIQTRYGVCGGADAAIVYNLTMLLNAPEQYEIIGLVENDVLLSSGWFEKTMALFDLGKQDGLTVGAVSPRCFTDRILIQRDGFALMHNLGAGVVLFTREAAEIVLANFRTGHTLENRRVFAQLCGKDIGTYWAFGAGENQLCSDWQFDKILATNGLASLALTPSPVEMIGQVPPLAEQGLTIASEAYPWGPLRGSASMFDLFVERVAALRYAYRDSNVPYAYPDTNGSQVWFSHQLGALNALYIGDWKLAWSQGFGPFPFKAGDECSVTVAISGPCQVLLSGGTDGGHFLVEDTQSGYSNDPVLAPEAQTGIMGVQVPAGVAYRDIRITALKPGGRFYGIKVFEPQPSNPTWKFDHSYLPPV